MASLTANFANSESNAQLPPEQSVTKVAPVLGCSVSQNPQARKPYSGCVNRPPKLLDIDLRQS